MEGAKRVLVRVSDFLFIHTPDTSKTYGERLVVIDKFITCDGCDDPLAVSAVDGVACIQNKKLYAIVPRQLHVAEDIPTIEMPPSHSLRSLYSYGDKVYVARLTSNGICFFDASVISQTKEGLHIEYIARSGANMIQLVPFYCVYMYDWRRLHSKCKDAVYAWIFCAKVLGISKDMRNEIAKYVWRLRDESEWETLITNIQWNKKQKV